MQWGLDVVGPLQRALPQFRFLLIATDYFTKWIEAVSLSEVTGQQIVKFLWQNIIYRFGLHHAIISDNVIRSSTVYPPLLPQGNGQAEINNRTILDSLWKSLGKAKGK